MARLACLTAQNLLTLKPQERVAERSPVTADQATVLQYNEVMTTKLALAYAIGLEIAYRAHPRVPVGPAIDLACGPGHFAICLVRYLGCAGVLGVDLSEAMVAVARKNAERLGIAGRLEVREGDIMKADALGAFEPELCTFTNAAHHLPNLAAVTEVLRQMDRITLPEGLVLLMDLVRLRSRAVTEEYVNTLGHDYCVRGLERFLEEFRASMYAAWTAEELHSAIPRDSARWWCHIIPRGLPSVQLVVGLPVGRKRVFVRSGFPWRPDQNPVPQEMRAEWRLLRWSLRLGRYWYVPPA